MGRAPCCDKVNVKKGPWSPDEDSKLKEYIEKHGTGGNWIALPQKAGLRRCGKSCRLRWLNYLRPNLKHGEFSDDEDRIICSLYANIGSRWSIIASQLPGRTDNDIKNYWNTKLKKKLLGILPPHKRLPLVQNIASPTDCSLTSHETSSSFTRTAQTSSIQLSTGITHNIVASSPLHLPPHLLPFQYQSPYNQLKEGLPMFGADQSFSPNSDRSISYKYNPQFNEHIDQQVKYIENFIFNGLGENPDQKSVSTTPTSMNEMSLFDIGIEDIKQLITANDHMNGNIHSETGSDHVFLSDQSAMRCSKAKERPFLYY